MSRVRPSLIGSERRLALALALFFLALAVPAGLLAARAWQQVQQEVIERHRLAAEEATTRLDAALARMIATEDARGFADYSYAPAGTGRSPLAAFPVASALPGVLGYFQVAADGTFSTPLLPRAASVVPPDAVARTVLADRLYELIAGKRVAPGRDPAPGVADTAALREEAATPVADNVLARLLGNVERQRTLNRDGDYARIGDLDDAGGAAAREPAARRERTRKSDAKALAAAPRAVRKEQVLEFAAAPVLPAPDVSGARADGRMSSASASASASAAASAAAPQVLSDGAASDTAVRSAASVVEYEGDAFYEDVAPAAHEEAAPPERRDAAAVTALASRRVQWFQSEIEPMKFEQLDDAHFVLFRNVWRDGARLVQGAVIERRAFLDAMRMRAVDTVAGAVRLSLAWDGRLLDAAAVAAGAGLLYRGRLSAPFARFELAWVAVDLPLGASARYLSWVAVSLLLVLVLGCVVIYRFGAGQLRLARQQQDFVSAVSHELKTPLTSIRMYAEMLRAGWTDADRRQTYYRYIHDESERLSRLIANVLQLARLSRGQRVVELRAAALDTILAPIVDKLRAQCEQAGFELVYEPEPLLDAVLVTVDDDALTQVLINLVDNAIKFTPGDGARRVVLRTREAGAKRVAVTVRDFGAGIPKAQMRRIFERFYRGAGELTRDTVGTGIGLALVAELAAGMGARVDVLNREPGAEFVLELARAA